MLHGKELSQNQLEVLFYGLFPLDDLPVARHKILDIQLGKPPDALCQRIAVASRQVCPPDTHVKQRVSRQKYLPVLPVQTYGAWRVAGSGEHSETFFSEGQRALGQKKAKRTFRHLAAGHHEEVSSLVLDVFVFSPAHSGYYV